MNACDDGDEPLGEAPELSGVRALLRASDAAVGLVVAVNKIRDLHRQDSNDDEVCTCGLWWPCDTAEALDEAGLP